MIKDFLNFVLRGDSNKSISSNVALVLLFFYFLDMIQKVLFMVSGQSYLKYYTDFDSSLYKGSELVSNTTTIQLLLISLLIMPVLEELMFRLPVLINRKNLLIGMGALITYIFYVNSTIYMIEIYIVIISVFLCAFYFTYKTPLNSEYKYFKFVMLVSCTVFSVMHFFNFEMSVLEAPLFFAFIFISYFISGLIYCYIRFRYSITYSILLHITMNILPTIVLIYRN